jgi:hypothetical protein
MNTRREFSAELIKPIPLNGILGIGVRAYQKVSMRVVDLDPAALLPGIVKGSCVPGS